jgi:hypothetical protein
MVKDSVTSEADSRRKHSREACGIKVEGEKSSSLSYKMQKGVGIPARDLQASLVTVESFYQSMKLLSLWKISLVALFGGFLAIFYMILFPSFLFYYLQINETTIDVIVSTSLVLLTGIIYIATERRLQKSFNRGRIPRGIARIIILAAIAGVTIGMFYSPIFFQDIAGAFFFSSFSLRLQLIFRAFLQDVIYSTFFLWFTAAFVSISTFNILRTRESNRSDTLRLNNPPTVR